MVVRKRGWAGVFRGADWTTSAWLNGHGAESSTQPPIVPSAPSHPSLSCSRTVAVKEGDSALGFLVFAAIMLHKAPGAFGMTSYLLHAGVGRAGVRSRLVLFSLAAPTGALLTYWLLSLNLFVYNSESVALCLLFSGGTFLYVATAHVLPEITGCECGTCAKCLCPLRVWHGTAATVPSPATPCSSRLTDTNPYPSRTTSRLPSPSYCS